LAVAAAAGCVRTAAPTGPLTRADPQGDPFGALRVMTFNVRYGTAPDGPDAWPLRRPLALRVIRDYGPTVLGMQEALRPQLDDVRRSLPWYAEVGVGRNDGARAGEYAAILYDHHRLKLLTEGWFWLSDTPEVPGSMTWGNRFPRMVTWARFTDRTFGGTFLVYNTHWDHESQVAREKSAELLLRHLRARQVPGEPVLLLGDLNCADDNPAFTTLTGGALTETLRAAHPTKTTRLGTFHGFGGGRDGRQIDFILVSPLFASEQSFENAEAEEQAGWHVLEADIVRTSEGRRYPSDHFPVTATLLISRVTSLPSTF
jgi:endonuclease/exonuclease/phosphatase family metal-dependent hydrolase